MSVKYFLLLFFKRNGFDFSHIIYLSINSKMIKVYEAWVRVYCTTLFELDQPLLMLCLI
jgi:hypothetical protein